MINGENLVFSTTKYKAERGSILSPGIYNFELSAFISAAMLAAISFWLLRGKGALDYITSFAVFASGFLLLRLFVFTRRELEFYADKLAGTISIHIPFKGKDIFRFLDIEEIAVREKTLAPENPEGLKMVEKIALHHYTVLPDLDKELRLYTLELKMKSGSVYTLYASEDENEVNSLRTRLGDFLNA